MATSRRGRPRRLAYREYRYNASCKYRRVDVTRPLGEALLLGREPLHRKVIEGLHTDAFTLFAEVIESKCKPAQAWGEIAQAAFGEAIPSDDKGSITQTILAVGRQDIDPDGLTPPQGISILAASSDHLIVDSSNYPNELTIGSEIPFQVNYSALLRAMTSPYIAKVMTTPEANDTTSQDLNVPTNLSNS